MALLLILVVVAVISVALSAWLLDRTRSDEGECDCTRCAEKRHAVDERWSA